MFPRKHRRDRRHLQQQRKSFLDLGECVLSARSSHFSEFLLPKPGYYGYA